MLKFTEVCLSSLKSPYSHTTAAPPSLLKFAQVCSILLIVLWIHPAEFRSREARSGIATRDFGPRDPGYILVRDAFATESMHSEYTLVPPGCILMTRLAVGVPEQQNSTQEPPGTDKTAPQKKKLPPRHKTAHPLQKTPKPMIVLSQEKTKPEGLVAFRHY